MPGCCGAPQAIASGATKREVLRGRLGARRDEINAAIEVLLEDGFLAEADGSLTVALAWLPFDGSSEAEKLDSVRHFLDAVSGALLGRFFTTPPDDDAFAGVLTFCTPPEELEPTRTALFEAMSEAALRLDARATEAADSASLASVSPARTRRSTRRGAASRRRAC